MRVSLESTRRVPLQVPLGISYDRAVLSDRLPRLLQAIKRRTRQGHKSSASRVVDLVLPDDVTPEGRAVFPKVIGRWGAVTGWSLIGFMWNYSRLGQFSFALICGPRKKFQKSSFSIHPRRPSARGLGRSKYFRLPPSFAFCCHSRGPGLRRGLRVEDVRRHLRDPSRFVDLVHIKLDGEDVVALQLSDLSTPSFGTLHRTSASTPLGALSQHGVSRTGAASGVPPMPRAKACAVANPKRKK
jgi:hypothetical protein